MKILFFYFKYLDYFVICGSNWFDDYKIIFIFKVVVFSYFKFEGNNFIVFFVIFKNELKS